MSHLNYPLFYYFFRSCSYSLFLGIRLFFNPLLLSDLFFVSSNSFFLSFLYRFLFPFWFRTLESCSSSLVLFLFSTHSLPPASLLLSSPFPLSSVLWFIPPPVFSPSVHSLCPSFSADARALFELWIYDLFALVRLGLYFFLSTVDDINYGSACQWRAVIANGEPISVAREHPILSG